MRAVAMLLVLVALVLGASPAQAGKSRTHVVASGQTLGGIAKRYQISIAALCTANGIPRNKPIRIGQKLVIPAKDDPDGKRAAQAGSQGGGSSAAPRASGPPGKSRSHKVAPGQTLGGIANRFGVTISAVCTANGIPRNKPIRVGQQLIIPAKDDEDGKRAAQERKRAGSNEKSAAPTSGGGSGSKSGQQILHVPGAPPAYYYEPTGPGRMTLRPVIFYLHGSGGSPSSDCRRWAPVARRFGWLVCPTAANTRADGRPKWVTWTSARRVVKAALAGLRAKYGRRVQLYGNTLIGFSEGTFVAMNIGVREPRTFNRWLLIASTDRYWGGKGLQALQRNRNAVRRVYLLTGELDGTLAGTSKVLQTLRRSRITSKIYELAGYGHQVPLHSKASLFESALRWLQQGGKVPSTERRRR